jgi:hypothetical protein
MFAHHKISHHMATNKPSSTNSPSGKDSPKDRQNDDGAPQDGTLSNSSEDEKKQIKNLFCPVYRKAERKTSEHLHEFRNCWPKKKMMTNIQENTAHYSAKLEMLKGKVEGGHKELVKASFGKRS